MRYKPFKLEEFFAKHEFAAKYFLCCSDAESFAMQEILKLADGKDREMWDNLDLCYGETSGVLELRQAITQAFYPGLTAENILISAGTEDGIFCALNALINHEDHVIVMTPCYQSLLDIPKLLTNQVTEIKLDQEWRIDLNILQSAVQMNTKCIIINFPHNPTGQVLEQSELDALVELCQAQNIWLFSDEVYRFLGVPANRWCNPVASAYNMGLSVSGMSKSFGMGGLRVGWIACQNQDLLQKIKNIKYYKKLNTSILGPNIIHYSMSDKLLWLQIARSIGPVSFHTLKQKYSNPTDVLQYLINNNKKITPEAEIRDEVSKVAEYGANLIFIDDPEYPHLLKLIRDAPAFLTIKGNCNSAARFISIIGSRNSSINANKIAFNLAEKLVECGISIVSGLARGIDRHAHLGGIKDTIAVLGCGVDHIYPHENSTLYHDIILNGGAIISEARIGTHPAPNLFRARNRIIAGLSLGSVIVQGTQYSGSLVTAQYAADYNREVFAVPGCPLDPRSYGPNNLIKNGAALVQDHNDILQQLLNEVPKLETTMPEEHYTNDESLRDRVLNYLSSVPTSIDDLQAHLSVPIPVIRETLVQLDLDELIKHTPGDRVVRIYN